MKVKDQGHITGKYQDLHIKERNLNLSLSKEIDVMFHNLQGCHFIFQGTGKYRFKINIILKAIEIYMKKI